MVYSPTSLKDFIFKNKPQKMMEIYFLKRLIKVRQRKLCSAENIKLIGPFDNVFILKGFKEAFPSYD
jgi:hypothetical protein